MTLPYEIAILAIISNIKTVTIAFCYVLSLSFVVELDQRLVSGAISVWFVYSIVSLTTVSFCATTADSLKKLHDVSPVTANANIENTAIATNLRELFIFVPIIIIVYMVIFKVALNDYCQMTKQTFGNIFFADAFVELFV
jgi:hypothetical protein